MIHNVIASGSTGNCEIYHSEIMIDCGVPFSAIESCIKDLKIIMLSHIHGDHFNLATIKKIQEKRPSVRVVCGEWMLPLLDGVRNIDVLGLNKWYDYKHFKIAIGKLYHGVENCFFRIEKNGHKTFRATDTCHLEGISAKGYDLYALEHNFCEEKIHEQIKTARLNGDFTHSERAINTHLSVQQAQKWLYENKGEHSQIIRLHESKFNS